MIREDNSRNEELAKVCDDLGISLLVLFGSQAEQSTHDKSDVDMGYSRDEPLSLEAYTELRESILEATDFSTSEIDLVHLDGANPLLLKKILDTGERVLGSEAAFQSFKRRAFHRYCDFKPYLEKEKQFVEDRLDELTSDG